MGTEYQIFNWKEYVSLRRFWNMEGKYKTEKAKNEELEEENKKLKDYIKKWEDKRMRKLAEIYNMPTKYLSTAILKNEWYSSWYDTVKRKMLHELWFDRLDVQDLLKENKKLKKENEEFRNINQCMNDFVSNYIFIF